MLPEHEVRAWIRRIVHCEERLCLMADIVKKLTEDVEQLVVIVNDGLASITTEFNAFRAKITELADNAQLNDTDIAVLQDLDGKVMQAISDTGSKLADLTAPPSDSSGN